MSENNQILDRYRFTENGEVLIEITADRIRDIYNDFDKLAPFQKKELDTEFVDYLIYSVEEIGDSPFVIRLNFRYPLDPQVPGRIQQSVRNYFIYLDQLERQSANRILRNSLMLFTFGSTVLISMVLLSINPAAENHLTAKLMVEGLTVAAWVSLWESATRFFTGWPSRRQNRRLYQKIIHAKVEILQASETD